MDTRPLYGGAISCPVGNSFLDVSNVRQVPDNQEVFVDMDTQQSLIIELLEPVEAVNEDIARFHFQQLADDNEATEAHVNSVIKLDSKTAVPRLPSDTTIVHMLRGTQKVAKFNEAKDMAYNTVEIRMAVVRLAQVETDLVISINAPILVAPGSTDQATTAANVEQHIEAILSQLQVNDWSLFG
ncbi:ran guanine nucleotide release factor-like [Lichtheimia corymbifera JMRC:FSU:9682]|uniref:Ran guanine nucleotide release factor-like n=1 Tax=Lichtheimia corymbifera JMRC:FSU:9682 TaxID=1263082 RepID=A0A068S4J7_9FUNG|nr:ran guanine nucleotide release factor-like [Lichtheimia corymbifera JMRC:FSU:9682]